LIGAIQRSLLALEQQGADKLFGEPALNLADLLQTSAKGEGVVNILVADQLIQAPNRYATFLLWLLSDLYERLHEVGDPPKPKLIFFFDEAHLLFEDAPKALVDKIEQVVRLIRSKGVGIYFVTQNPLDLPDRVLGQLGNRVQHALRAFTPRDQKAVKAAVLHVSFIRLGACGRKYLIIFSPYYERRRLVPAKAGLPFRIPLRIAAITIEESYLNLGVSWPVKQWLVDVPIVRADCFLVPNAMEVLPLGGSEIEEATQVSPAPCSFPASKP
jgi:DNA helicase HerA-like ATPase